MCGRLIGMEHSSQRPADAGQEDWASELREGGQEKRQRAKWD